MPESHQSSLLNRSELGSQSVSNTDKGSQLVGLGSDQNGEFDAYDCIAFDKVFCIYKAPAPFDPRKIFHSKQQNYVLFSGKFLLGKSSWINHLTFSKIGLPPPSPRIRNSLSVKNLRGGGFGESGKMVRKIVRF